MPRRDSIGSSRASYVSPVIRLLTNEPPRRIEKKRQAPES